MIRIRTTFTSKGERFIPTLPLSQDKWRVHTFFFNGKWVTLASGGLPINADTLLEAGQNHLKAAASLRDKLKPSSKDSDFFDDFTNPQQAFGQGRGD